VTGTREDRLAETLVELADTLVDDFDVIDFLHRLAARCVELLGIDAAGLMLVDPYGQLRVMAASNERARLMDLMQIQSDSGPCVTCYRTAASVLVSDIRTAADRWPVVADRAAELGLRAVFALPMRLRNEVIGVANLFRAEPGPLGEPNERIGQAMADVATIGILQARAVHRREVVAEQLQTALNTRVVIEQAKGVLAERFTLDMDTAFRALRQYARSHQQRLSDVAYGVVRGSTDIDAIAASVRDASADDGSR